MSYFYPYKLYKGKLKIFVTNEKYGSNYVFMRIGNNNDGNYGLFINNLIKFKSNYFVLFFTLLNLKTDTEDKFAELCC